MISECEDDLVCDLAETYGIFDMRSMPPALLATLANGLKPDSRTKKKLTGEEAGLDTLLLAQLVDQLSLLMWGLTKDGAKGRNRPESIVDSLTRNKKQKESNKDLETYKTPDEFMLAWKQMGGGV